jgi:GT2 family glycosyltransferase
MSTQRSIVVLGLMTKLPVAGVVWQTLHYLLGFERLGFRAYYVEAHARTPSMLMSSPGDDASARGAAFLAGIMRRFGFGDRWAFHALHDDGRCFGMRRSEVDRLYASAEVLVNLHGGTLPRDELTATDRLVYVETDPVAPQVELAQGVQATVDFLERHCAHFTFAENYGAADCRLPVSDRFTLHPTRQPVVLDLWDTDASPRRREFTTIGNWRQQWRDVSLDGETYGWSKDAMFGPVLDLPARAGPRFELALASYAAADERLLTEHGWRVTPALAFSMDLDRYRDYVRASYGEFTVAKDQNVRLRTGWFSDRSATYLAAGRPVITQDTGFGRALPADRGLFAFSCAEEAADAVARIDRDPEVHRRAAREIAREHFAAERVLGAMLDHLGVRPPGLTTGSPAGAPFPLEMSLAPVSRRPLRLPDATLQAVDEATGARRDEACATPAASIVIVTHGGAAVTKLCLETVLGAAPRPTFEVIVVDNASPDATPDYLRSLVARDARVQVVLNAENRGFPAACNQGLALARGRHLVLLNNDTMVPPGWLGRLLAPLRDEQIGLAGAVTNRIGNEAEVPTSYATWGGFLREARTRADAFAGQVSEIGTVTMFCLAMRRDAYARLGPLDEGYDTGMLEDDDYSMRARRAGYRLVCAEDVLVHHFGEASFGALFADGERDRLLERNRARFEERWGEPWKPYARRTDPAYDALVDDVRARLAGLPAEATVLVVSRGDERLVDIPGRRAWHFPRTPDGRWAGHHPADSAEAIALVAGLAGQGATHIAFPRTALWWLEHYEGLAHHLADVAIDEPCCRVFTLR